MTTESATEEACYCCGRSVPVEQLARMLCHPEVTVCAGCAEWLATRSKTLVRAVPVLHTYDLDASMRFWEAAGFDMHRFGEGRDSRSIWSLTDPTVATAAGPTSTPATSMRCARAGRKRACP